MTRTTVRSLTAAALITGFAMTVWAAPANIVRARGTIEKIDGNILDVKLRDGSAAKLKLAEKLVVGAVIPIKLTDIKAGQMVGVTSIPQADGTLKAYEVHVFPAQQRVNEGHTPYDTEPNSQMTNGRLETSVAGVNGQVLTVKYKQGDKVEEKKVTVTPQTIITTRVPGEKSELKPGASFVVFRAVKEADGTLEVDAIAVGRGIAPPM